MVRSSALYISLIVSILIVLVCGSLLMIGFTYKMQEKRQERIVKLRENVLSAMQILLLNDFKPDTIKQTSLFGHEADSVSLEKKQWGVYEVGTVKSWIGSDTLGKAFLIGTSLADSLKVLYLADEDRPMSITGNSIIKGTAYLPKAGIKAAYVESSGYDDKILVHGATVDSKKDLPEPDATLLKNISDLLESGQESDTERLPDSIDNSFFNPVKRIFLGKEATELSGFKAKGNVVISSDSLIIVDADCSLDRVILIAPYVKIESDFKGNLQVIASDSIIVGDSVKLTYPSALLVLKNDTAKFQAKISIGKNALVEGQLFAYEKDRTLLMPIISVGEKSLINGEIWSEGYVGLSKTAEVHGSVSAIRLMAMVGSAIYENYLIDVRLDKLSLSRYYLSSRLLNAQTKRGKLLCWLK